MHTLFTIWKTAFGKSRKSSKSTNGTIPSFRRSRFGRDDRGAVTVEMAITMPLLFLIVFTSVEFGRMNVIRHSAEHAAYEAAREGIIPGVTAADVRARANQIMGIVGARGFSIDIQPPQIDFETPTVEVTVTVPTDANGFIAPRFFRGRQFVGRSQLKREVLIP